MYDEKGVYYFEHNFFLLLIDILANLFIRILSTFVSIKKNYLESNPWFSYACIPKSLCIIPATFLDVSVTCKD